MTSNGYVLDESETRLAELEPVPPAERRDRDALWARLRREGYLYLKGQLKPGQLLDFREFYFESLAANVYAAGTDPRDGIAAPGDVDRAALRRGRSTRRCALRKGLPTGSHGSSAMMSICTAARSSATPNRAKAASARPRRPIMIWSISARAAIACSPCGYRWAIALGSAVAWLTSRAATTG